MSSTLTSRVSTTRPDGLQRLLGGLEVDTFLQDYIGERMLYVSGAPDRWADLFSWRDLNSVLSEGFVHHPRMRLVQGGVELDPTLYTYERGERRWPDAKQCHRLMADGATLVLMIVEGVNPRLEAFVRALERDLCADVRVDVVATCASVPGLNMHWDNAECFNLQLDGEKDWQVVQPQRPYPLTATHRFPQRKDVITSAAPEGPPTWSGTVVPGDLIYLPRGWWHAVTPRVTPSLHLSVAVEMPTLSDFLQWVAQESARHDVARQLLPVWQSAAERRTRLDEALAAFMASAMLSTDALETYLTHLTATPSRPDFALPAAASSAGSPFGRETLVRLQSTKPLRTTIADGSLTFEWNGQTYRFNAQVLPILRKLESMNSFTLDELSEGVDRMLATAFVVALVTAGLAGVTERASSHT